VGHEVDFSICDFASDLRAPTPSAAAELVSGEHEALVRRLRENLGRMERRVDQRLRDARARLRAAMGSYGLRSPENLLLQRQQRVDEALRRLDVVVERRLREARARAAAAQAALAGHDPGLILSKGYAIVRAARGDRVLTRSDQARVNMAITTEFADGRIRSVVTGDEPDLFTE
jgi:exodeoxyribonuclease VII large subunit